ncbi:MAG: glycine zipper family protein [Muribaculaceae bacterium]|nr:glycine zipper family protein [Muribaculaceae bacterium]
MKKLTILGLCALMLVTSGCESSRQFYGVATGASLGGMFGSAIGGIAGGRRGHDLGTVTGMAIGGLIGAAATTPKDKSRDSRSSDYYNGYDDDDYRTNNSYSPYSAIDIEDIRFIDSNDNRCIDAGEKAKLTFIVRNTGRDFVYDIAPVITVTGTKQIYLSPTAIISELPPGRAVRYTAEVVATKKLKSGEAVFSIGFSDGDLLYTLGSFNLRTRAR